ncbi:RNA polymerase sigma factor [Aureimonas glaciei]|uniref:RNA polymerase sigma factor n=2 Tax=Aureimonas glaciei TaxID=1776957 RepID=A0A916XTB2_9HYPH|nr:RNA polymerase sigma factor [Aureimonas glaciei]
MLFDAGADAASRNKRPAHTEEGEMMPAFPPPPEGLDALLRAALRGDDRAYGAFLREAARALRAFAARRAPAAPGFDPEDLVQEILMAVHAKRHTWRQEEPVAPWLFAIARHKAVDAYRRHGRRLEIDIAEFAEILASPAAEAVPTPKDVARAVDSLDGRQRAVVASISVEGRSIGETAEKLKITEGAVRVAFHRGLAAIAARFGSQ